MLQIRAKKLTEGYAVNVDYIDIDTYTDVLNMLCAISSLIAHSITCQATREHDSPQV